MFVKGGKEKCVDRGLDNLSFNKIITMVVVFISS